MISFVSSPFILSLNDYSQKLFLFSYKIKKEWILTISLSLSTSLLLDFNCVGNDDDDDSNRIVDQIL
ncbi:hypothetical protein DERP_004790 [Dermatophagoides pteronyssinus]|uniref:Uncharacterized protein n=1 Tax=Dermatophagoides pteronyssinus TaxID=6956 RepID=A0ABQ8JTE8_DERPT|nr:hypothetical protein DERP_004790 [Dermatophagoides pteronyssinus]